MGENRFTALVDGNMLRNYRLHSVALLVSTLCGCVTHDQVRLVRPSPCRVRCDYDCVQPLDQACHGFQSTCWLPWSDFCPTCPPPPGSTESLPTIVQEFVPESVLPSGIEPPPLFPSPEGIPVDPVQFQEAEFKAGSADPVAPWPESLDAQW